MLADVACFASDHSKTGVFCGRTDGPLLKRSLSRLGSKELGSKENSRSTKLKHSRLPDMCKLLVLFFSVHL